jgi:hypothetical protein
MWKHREGIQYGLVQTLYEFSSLLLIYVLNQGAGMASRILSIRIGTHQIYFSA